MSFSIETYYSVSKYILNFLTKILHSFKNEKNDHPPPSSYPGIWKYPTDRDKPLRIAEQWLECKIFYKVLIQIARNVVLFKF